MLRILADFDVYIDSIRINILDPNAREIVAAVDLGSNSFHMIVCHLKDKKLLTIDRLKEMVRLASGLDKKNYLDEKTQLRALACLERFGERIQNFPTHRVRIVGTKTLRTAKNAQDFLLRAEAALGHPIHIISGIEEARLIYQGVAHSLQSDAKLRLVMDIGGGSTEYIIGSGDQPRRKESLNMGCVTLSNKFFIDGEISKKRFQHAVLYANQQLEPFQQAFLSKQWDEAIGASGSLRAVDKVLMANGWSNNGITLQGLEKLVSHMIKKGRAEALYLPELDPARAPVFPGGVAIVYATFKSLKIEQMSVSDGALREGLIFDLVGRIYNQDTRSETVKMLAENYRVDQQHAERIKTTLGNMMKQLDNFEGEQRKAITQFLDWAADLHEIGHNIAHSQYQKHGAYILENADMAGFSWQDQQLLSAIVLAHRRKFPKKRFAKLHAPWNTLAPYLAIILRLAVILHRNRHINQLPDVKFSIKQQKITLVFPEQWLMAAPLTNADLIQEAKYLRKADFELSFS